MSNHQLRLVVIVSTCILLAGGGVGCSKKDSNPTAPSAANLVVTPTTWDFGAIGVGGSGSKLFTMTNTGNAAFSGLVTENGAEFNIPDFGSGSFTLQPNASETFHVVFSPTSTGTKSCTLTTGSGGPSVTLAGTGS